MHEICAIASGVVRVPFLTSTEMKHYNIAIAMLMYIIKSNTYLEKPLTADALDLHVMIVEAVAPEAAPGLGVVGVADPVTVRAGVGEAGAGAAVEAADPLQVEAAQSLVLIDAVAPGLPDHVVTVLDILLVSCTFQLLNN